jgi:hypothetical protein
MVLVLTGFNRKIGWRDGLKDIVGVGRKRIPDQVPWDAGRLECLVFSGYDPHFEGDEPP